MQKVMRFYDPRLTFLFHQIQTVAQGRAPRVHLPSVEQCMQKIYGLIPDICKHVLFGWMSRSQISL